MMFIKQLTTWSWHDYWLYFKRLTYWFRLASWLLLLAVLIGAAAAQTGLKTAADAIGPLETLIELLRQLSWWQMILVIFINNALTLVLMVFGGLLIGIIPLGILLYNGYLLGLVGWSAVINHNLATALAALIPHGLPEILLVVLATGLGFHLGHMVQISWQRGDWSNLKSELLIAGRILVVVILPILALAAAIEILITPIVLFWVCPDCLPAGF